MSATQKRKCFLDPCHSKCINLSKLQLSRMKLKMKLELRTLKKIADEVVHEGDSSYVVVVPANVYENPLDTIPIQSFEGINGCYGSATEEQLKSFFGENIPYNTTAGAKDLGTSARMETEPTKETLPSQQLETVPTPGKSVNTPPASFPVDDIELQNAIWNIAPELSLEDTTAPTDQMSFDDFLMDHADHDDTGVLFDLS
ncbi:uncharacterized protein LOC119068149 [Bradysia coprophila]|uniref:uncharacterized protein LOC119068149 n=1 Tax=Bradysia coprophila TaxID=38358 RepID=UPI00187DB635|nr:uncharacterized protein LOC119068149 [Bradysia coprophila]